MNRKNCLFVIAVLALVAVSGCKSTFSPPPVVVSLIPAPPATLEVQISTSVSATVSGDTQNGGVDWTVTCGSSNCGTFSAAHTASGASTTYTAPPTPPAGNTVTITATSVDSTDGASASATITINPVAAASNLAGQYSFYVGGYDTGAEYYVAAGSVTLDGMGNVTAGEEDFNNGGLSSVSIDDLLTGTYTVGANGSGTMTVTATSGGSPDTSVGVGGTQTFAFTVVNNNHALIEEFDSAFTSVGSMDLQTTTALSALTGGFSFYFAGYDSGSPYVAGGVVSADGMGDFTSMDSVDQDEGGRVFVGASFSGSISGTIDTMGRALLGYGGRTFAIYVIGPEVFRMVDIDSNSFPVVGTVYGQGSGSGSFSAASLTGTYVFSNQGNSEFFTNEQVGLLALNGSGTVSSGVIDYNEGGIVPPAPPAPDAITGGTYTLGANGYGSATGTITGLTSFTGSPYVALYGVYATDPALNLSDPNNTTAGGGSALVVELDTDSLGHGVLVSQTATATAAGNDAISVDGEFDTSNIFEVADIVGQISSNGTSGYSGTGAANILFASPSDQNPSATLTGTFTADSTNVGRYTGTLDFNGAVAPYGQVFYQVNSGLALHILEDPLNAASGVIEGQQ